MIRSAFILTAIAILGLAGPGTIVADPAIERVSVTPRSDGEGYVLRLHANEKVPAFSSPESDGAGGYSMSLFKTGLTSAIRDNSPPAPLLSYEFERVDGELIFKFRIASGRFNVSAYHDRDSPDVLIGLVKTNEVVAEANIVQAQDGPTVDARERWLLDTIVIDAGHGGHDPGNVKGSGSGYVREKDVTLAVALKLGEYLEERLGVNVVYTRKSDKFVDLKKRGEIANSSNGKLFISIHANAFKRSAVSGTETYILGLHKSENARRVMEAENSVIFKYEDNPEAYAHLTTDALVRMTLAQSAYLKQSEHVAALVEEQFAERVGRHSRGVKQAGFMVLWVSSMPAILVELGYLSNPADRRFLTSELGQDYMASAIFRAIRDYKMKFEENLTQTPLR